MPLVILDTDIGSDVDDALALAFLLGSPEVDLLAVTTVYGNTALRARLAQRLLRLAGRHEEVPVLPGAGTPLSGREVWWAGHEGSSFADLEEEVLTDEDGVEHLVRAVADRPGQVDVLAVGPLTNIALALERDPAFAQNVRSLHVMGGDFGASAVAEHNIVCDVDAAARVFASRMPITVTGLDVTTTVRLEPAHVQRIAASGALGAALHQEIDTWWRFHGQAWNNPHDPVAAAAMLRADLFDSSPGDVEVVTTREGLGRTELAPATRRTQVTTASAHEHGATALVTEIVDRCCAAGTAGTTPDDAPAGTR